MQQHLEECNCLPLSQIVNRLAEMLVIATLLTALLSYKVKCFFCKAV